MRNTTRLVTIGTALAAAVLVGGYTMIPSGQTTLEREMAATVMVQSGGGHGSGVAVGPDLILTAAHVVAGETDFTVHGTDGVIHPAEILWASPTRDVAMLRITDGAKMQTAEMACRLPVLDEPITGIGNPIVARFYVAQGRVASVMPIDAPGDDTPFVHGVPVDMGIAAGMSGGPAFDADGRVLGLMEAVMIQKIGPMSASLTAIGVIVPSDRICALLGRSA